ncbi:MAG: hypothetical protein K2W94_04060 [Alphaproteobacteria bacterium]|nr:hypothetical protein [Alphaproteobacteria bacterium]
MSLGFVFSPGWSFDREFFKPLATYLKDYQHVYLEDNPDLSKGIWIGIGHSLGFSRLLSLPLQGLVSISGFVRFCAHNPAQTGTPLRVIDRMIEKFEIDPKAVLKDFYKQAAIPNGSQKICRSTKTEERSVYEIREHRRSDVGRTDILKNEGYMENSLTDPFIRFNKKQLLDNLEFMKKMDFTSAFQAMNVPMLSLAAKDDQIVPFALTEETFKSSIILEKGGHGMGYTHADWCAKKIKNWISNDLNF